MIKNAVSSFFALRAYYYWKNRRAFGGRREFLQRGGGFKHIAAVILQKGGIQTYSGGYSWVCCGFYSWIWARAGLLDFVLGCQKALGARFIGERVRVDFGDMLYFYGVVVKGKHI